MSSTGYFQVQPVFSQKEQWSRLAERENLKFEALELSTRYLDSPELAEEWYGKCGRTASVHGVFMDNYPVSPDSQIREVSRRRCEKSCETAVRIGAKNVVFHSTALTFVRGGLDDVWARNAAEYYGELADRYDLKIWIENFSDLDPGPMRKMMERSTSDRLGICLDAGHAGFSRRGLENWLGELSPWIGYLHLSDNFGLWDDHMPLGKGIVELDVLDRWWKKQKREIPITLEVREISDVETSLSYLRENRLFGF